MLEDEVSIFMHPDLVVLRGEIAHDDVIAAACALIIAASSRIYSVGLVFLFGTERHDLDDGSGDASEDAGFFEEIAGAFKSLESGGGGAFIIGCVEPEMRCRQADPLVCRRGIGGGDGPSERE